MVIVVIWTMADDVGDSLFDIIEEEGVGVVLFEYGGYFFVEIDLHLILLFKYKE